MTHRAVRLSLAGVTFIAGISVRYEGHAAVRNTASSSQFELPAPTVTPIRKATIQSRVIPSSCLPGNLDRRLPVRIEHVRLEPTPDADVVPSSSVAFDMVNTGSTSITDIMFEISILSEPARHFEHLGILLAGPYRLRTTVVLHPGDTMSFEMRLSNLSADCECAANARLIAARSIDD